MAASSLPAEVITLLLSMLSPPEMARAACVCRAWRDALAASPLWQATFERTFGPATVDSLMRRAAPNAPNWRAALVERYRAGAGWRNGRCTAHTLKAANSNANLFRIVDDLLISGNEDGASGGCAHARRLRA